MQATRGWMRTAKVLLAAGVLLAAPVSKGADELRPLAIQIYPGFLGSFLAAVAQEQGFYKANGLDVKLVPLGDGPRGLAALEGGSIQLAQNNTDFMLLARKRGLDLMVVAGTWGEQFTVMARNDVQLPDAASGYPAVMKDLVGKKIGVSARGAGTEYGMRTLLTAAGLDPDSVTYIAVGGTAGQVPALRTGNVDAVVAAGVGAAVVKAMGIGKAVVDLQAGQGPKDLLSLANCYEGYFGKRAWVDANADTLRRFVKAQQQAEAWARDPANADKLVDKALAVAPIGGVDDPRAVMKAYLQTAQYHTVYNRECAQGWSTLMMHNKLLDAPVDPAAFVWTGAPQK